MSQHHVKFKCGEDHGDDHALRSRMVGAALGECNPLLVYVQLERLNIVDKYDHVWLKGDLFDKSLRQFFPSRLPLALFASVIWYVLPRILHGMSSQRELTQQKTLFIQDYTWPRYIQCYSSFYSASLPHRPTSVHWNSTYHCLHIMMEFRREMRCQNA